MDTEIKDLLDSVETHAGAISTNTENIDMGVGALHDVLTRIGSALDTLIEEVRTLRIEMKP